MKKRSLFCMLTMLGLSLSCLAKSPVFKATKNSDAVYIGGTVHLLSETDHPLPPGFELAYANTDSIITEVSFAELKKPESLIKLQSVMALPEGKLLKDVLTETTYERLKAFLASRSLPIQLFEKMRPSGVSLNLSLLEYQRLGATPAFGVEAYMSNSRPLAALETVDEQVGFLSALNGVDQDALLRSSLDDLARAEQIWNSVLSAWKNGDMKKLDQLGYETMQADFPGVFKVLVSDRNLKWANSFVELQGDDDTELVLVGALHLPGKGGLLDLLEQRGWQITQLD